MSAQRTKPTKDKDTRAASVDQEDEPLSKNLLQELRRRSRDMANPIRYAIASEFSRRFILYYDVTRDVFVMNEPSSATLFKRHQAAQAIKKLLGRHISIVKFTTKGGKLRRLSPHPWSK